MNRPYNPHIWQTHRITESACIKRQGASKYTSLHSCRVFSSKKTNVADAYQQPIFDDHHGSQSTRLLRHKSITVAYSYRSQSFSCLREANTPRLSMASLATVMFFSSNSQRGAKYDRRNRGQWNRSAQ